MTRSKNAYGSGSVHAPAGLTVHRVVAIATSAAAAAPRPAGGQAGRAQPAGPAAEAAPPVPQGGAADPVLTAMSAELERSRKELRLEGYEAPYFNS